MTRLRPLQVGAVAGAALVGLWSVAGLIANPDFSTGSAVSSRTVLGSDMNGWHAVSGLLIAVPLLAFLRRVEWLRPLVLVSGLSLLATAVWALLDDRPAGLFDFPHQGTDAVLHVATASVLLAGLAAERRAARTAVLA